MWKTVDELCYKSKNVYNAATYITRQWFINNRLWLRAWHLDKLMQITSKEYYELGTQSSQCMLRLIEKNWKSYFVAIKDWSAKKGVGYSGMPKLPGYKKSDGRAILLLKPAMCYIKNDVVYFAWEPLRKFSGMKTNINTRIIETRFVPRNSSYWMELVYQENIPENIETGRGIIGIDLGIDNFATIANNTGATPIIINGKDLKSMNQYFNKTKSNIQSKTGMIVNNRIRNLIDKHMRKIDYYMHCATKKVIEYCLKNKIGTIVIGKNVFWKDEINMGHVNNQTFVSIPYEKFILKLKYKAQNAGICVIETEERYTSGTSFIDNEPPIKENYNKKRRIERGLFKSNEGVKINADLNGAYQIIKKVFPNAFEQGNRGCAYHPVRVQL